MKKTKLIFTVSIILHCLLNIGHCEAQWMQMSNGMGNNNNIYSLGTHDNNIFAGLYLAGVYISTNNGSNWTQSGLNNITIYSLAALGNYIFAGTDLSQGLFFSTNNGTNWTQTVLNNRTIRSLTTLGNNVFAGTDNYGVYLSSNYGANWTQTALNNQSIYSFAVNGNNIFAGTNGNGVFLSTNNGTNWNAVNNGLTNLSITTLAVSGVNLFAGTSTGGVFLSTNNGTNWTVKNNGLTNLNVTAFAVSGTNLFAGTGGGVFLSTNNGSSWYSKNVGFNAATFLHSILTVNNYIFAGTYSQSVWRLDLTIPPSVPILISPANDSTVNPLNLKLIWDRQYAFAFNLVLATDSTFTSIIIDTVLADTTKTLTNLNTATNYYWKVRSKNYINWSPFSSFFTFKTIALLPPALISPANHSTENLLNLNLIWNKSQYAVAYNVVLAADSAFTNIILNDSLLTDTTKALTNLNPFSDYYWKVRYRITSQWSPFSSFFTFKTSSPWYPMYSGMGGNQNVYAFASNGNNVFAGINGGGVYISTNNGGNWTAANSGLSNQNVSSLVTSGINLFAGTQGGGVFSSTNNGGYWIAVSSGLTSQSVYSLLSNGNYIFAGTSAGVFRSSNNGGSWTAFNSGLTNLNIRCLFLNGTNIYAGTYGGGAFLTTNDGLNWNSINTGLTNLYVNSFTVNGSNLFLGTNAGVFRSTNNGGSWGAGWLTNQSIYSLSVSGIKIFAGSGNGVFLSFNNGESWIELNQGFISNPVIRTFFIVSNYILAGTSQSVWRRNLSEIIGIKQISENLPTSYFLKQNYPNPFNPITKIRFDVPKQDFVTIKIFDVLGREVTTLVNEQLKPGTYEVDWDGSSYTSGVYFYTLTTDNFTETKKMVLVK